MTKKYIEARVRLAVENDKTKINAVMWYLGEHLRDFTKMSGPVEWVDGVEIVSWNLDVEDE